MSSRKYLWIFPDSQYRWMWKDFAHHLAARTGYRPVFIPFTEQDRGFYENQFGERLDAEVAVQADYLGYVVRGGDPEARPEAVIARAKAYEDRYGILLMRDMVLGCRHIGRGFIRGGLGHPESYASTRATHLLGLQACLKVADFFEDLSAKYPPGLALVGGGGGGVYMKPVSLICRARGAPFRSLVHSRFADYYYWADSEFEESAHLSQFIRNYPEPSPAAGAEVARRIRPTGLSVAGFQAMGRNIRWPRIAYLIAYTYAKHVYGRLKGYRIARVGYKPGSTARSLVRQRLHWNKLNRLNLKGIKDLEGRKLVYFPLQTEPEHSLNVLSPEHSNQYATVLELALSLPSDALLVVKEHPYQIGRRPAHYYEDLLELPNLVMVHPDEPSLELIRRVALVCVITGSAGYEAAVLGKPVVHFGRHGQIRDMPHVHRMEGFSDMAIIRELLDDGDPEAARRRKIDGARYFRAMEDYCLDFGPMNSHGREQRPTPDELRLIGESLLKTLPEFAEQLCA